ncbi:hypothetical protein HK100_002707 [Physocladia obscura]|uniref:Uncharacterized protein n=1 Tax=Physocladia obscura TaxID=109957 RepID=A0AAD5XE21_9FUNG|nr:hypothetical protein HK100_002707 [Physocladia obscura]
MRKAVELLLLTSIVIAQVMTAFETLWANIPSCAQSIISNYLGTSTPTSTQLLKFCQTLDVSLNDVVYGLQSPCTDGTDALADQVPKNYHIVLGLLPVCAPVNVTDSSYNIQALGTFWATQRDCVHTIMSQQLNVGSPPAGSDIAFLCSQGDNIGGIIADNMDPTVCPGFTTDQMSVMASKINSSIIFV